jgi:hypothetical protein
MYSIMGRAGPTLSEIAENGWLKAFDFCDE